MEINELRAYLDPRLEALEKTIRNITEPIVKDVDEIKGSIHELYNQDKAIEKEIAHGRERHGERMGKIEGKVKTLEDDKEDKKHSSQNIILIITIVITAAIAVIGWIR